jgi:hypothetical protein
VENDHSVFMLLLALPLSTAGTHSSREQLSSQRLGGGLASGEAYAVRYARPTAIPN